MKQYKPGITCVTLSKTPFEHEKLPEHITYLNRVQLFEKPTDFYEHWIKAVREVETEIFFMQDHDDPLPNKYPETVKGLYHGDYLECFGRTINRHSGFVYSKRSHISIPTFIHKGFCNTEAVHDILPYLPEKSDALPEGIVYFILANTFGRQYDSALDMVWVNHKDGMHHQSGATALSKTTGFLMKNGEDICARIKRKKA